MAADGGGQMSDIQRNLMLRTALLQTGVPQRKSLGTTTAPALGSTTRIKLFNVGILTSLIIQVVCPVTIGVAVAAISSRGPWNLISRIRLSDYDGTDRLNLSGFQLYILNCIRRRQAYGWANQVAASAGVISNPSIPTAVANGTISFFLEVPVCINDNRWDGLNQDLTGAIYAQTGVGELYLTIDWNSSLYTNGAIDSVYSGAATTTVALNGVTGPAVTVWQNYIFPQSLGKSGIPLPYIDLSSVYEVAGNIRSTDNIATNSEKLINFPNLRKVLGAYINFVNNGAVSSTDLSLLRTIVNGNNILNEQSQALQIIQQRLITEGDICAGGAYWWNFRDRPIETALFGNVQLGITPNVVAGTCFFEQCFESVYTKGAALPGMVQSS